MSIYIAHSRRKTSNALSIREIRLALDKHTSPVSANYDVCAVHLMLIAQRF